MGRNALVIGLLLLLSVGCGSRADSPTPIPPPPPPPVVIPPVCVTYHKFITWTNPETYTDNTGIAWVDQQEIITEVEVSWDGVNWILWATVENGGTYYETDLEICEGETLMVRARSTIKATAAQSAWSDVYEYIPTP